MAYELRAFNTRKTKKRQLLVHARKRNGAVRIGTVVGGKKTNGKNLFCTSKFLTNFRRTSMIFRPIVIFDQMM